MLTHTGTQTIETERLILRRFEYSDCDAVFKNWASDEELQSLYSEPVYSTMEETKGLLDKYIGNYSREDYYRWAVIDKVTGEGIGQIAYFLVDSKINLHKVQICTKTINVPSRRVIEKCGFTFEGTLRDYFYFNGQYIGRHYFSILRDEYESRR